MKPEATLRSVAEQEVSRGYAQLFESSKDPTEIKLQTFPKYVRRQDVTRFLCLYELFKQILPVKGSIIECGVFRGASLMTWAQLSAVLEPTNLTRRIYGFDSFEGFPHVCAKDEGRSKKAMPGELSSQSFEELLESIKLYDANRFLGHANKVELVAGNTLQSIPHFLTENPHLVVSLLFLDMDLYEPTKLAIEQFFPRIPKGGVIAFDELDNPIWPGETLAVLETLGIGNLRIMRHELDPYIGFVVKE